VTRSTRPDTNSLPVETRFLGGAVCLDFANTTEQLRSATPEDWLASYEVLLAWSRARGTLGVDAVERLARKAAHQPAAVRAVFAQALAVRTEIRALAAALVDGKSAPKILRRLNVWLEGLPPQPAIKVLAKDGRGRFELGGDRLDEPLWPILWSLTSLLTSDEITRVRRCAGHGCGYYFVDSTLNRSRRFCSTEGCGNRMRARRHYERHRPRA
jgi:predicted RNA-binding Zn ribbon-like protein